MNNQTGVLMTEGKAAKGKTGAGWTPGPWNAEPMVPLADNAFYITATPDGNNSAKDVATVGPCLAKTTAANARLIAAAPELYEALKIANASECSLWCNPSLNEHTSRCKTQRALLAKVRGLA